MNKQQNIIIYNTADGKASVSLYAKDGMVWMNQNQLAELFDTSIPNISMHISKILEENELGRNSVVKDYLTAAFGCQRNAVGVYRNTHTWFIRENQSDQYHPCSISFANPLIR